jgi:hypothetical protein
LVEPLEVHNMLAVFVVLLYPSVVREEVVDLV